MLKHWYWLLYYWELVKAIWFDYSPFLDFLESGPSYPNPPRARPLIVEILEPRVVCSIGNIGGAVYQVTGDGDGPGFAFPIPNPLTGAYEATTLRAAINAANADRLADTIEFNIVRPDTGKVIKNPTIFLKSPLPVITNTLTINGVTQPGMVDIDGGLLPGTPNGLVFTSRNNTIRGISITRFAGSGIIFDGSLFPVGHNWLAVQNFIGTTPGGRPGWGNGVGITIKGQSDDTIGGVVNLDASGGLPGARNVIAGNKQEGLLIVGVVTPTGRLVRASDGNVVAGNYFGLAPNGKRALPNGAAGIAIQQGARNNLIGGGLVEPGVSGANVISGNTNALGTDAGVSISTTNRFSPADGNIVTGNLIGTDRTGKVALPNDIGVLVGTDAHFNQIGLRALVGADGFFAAPSNVIAGNLNAGILLEFDNTNFVTGNYIGVRADGATALPNSRHGVQIQGGKNNQIGLARDSKGNPIEGAGNVISGNSVDGVDITGSGATGNTVAGDLIGTDRTGSKTVGNPAAPEGVQNVGVLIENGANHNTVGSPAIAAGGFLLNPSDVISGNSTAGVRMTGTGTTDNTVTGDYIGPTAESTALFFKNRDKELVPVQTTGVLIVSGASSNTVGGAAAGTGNLISGNGDGVAITNRLGTAFTGGNDVEGNYIGTTDTGAAALPNQFDGVVLRGNVEMNTVQANVISGNGGNGVMIRGDFATNALLNVVTDNRIGVDQSGTNPLGNGANGVLINDAFENQIGGAGPHDGNVISGNGQAGVRITGTRARGNTVLGNNIGTSADGSHGNGLRLPNRVGVRIDDGPTGNSIANSIIDYNTGAGIRDENDAPANTFTQNEIFGNGKLGIDLAKEGPTDLNLPVLTSAVINNNLSTITVVGSLKSPTPDANFTIEFFASPVGDPSGYGQGQVYLGSLTNVKGDGKAFEETFALKSLPAIKANWVITATATLPGQGTAEFSKDQTLVASTVTLNRLNNNTTAVVSFNDGQGHSGSEDVYLSQFNVTFTTGPNNSVTFNTFCIDLTHTVAVGQTYYVDARTDLTGAFTLGGRMAYIYIHYGEADLSANPDQAAAVQLVLWDLLLDNHDPQSFGLDPGTTSEYSSGDPNVFNVNFGNNPDAAKIAGEANTLLKESLGATTPGAWLDAGAAGDAANRGQSLLIPEAALQQIALARASQGASGDQSAMNNRAARDAFFASYS